jgi:hypothetical protein
MGHPSLPYHDPLNHEALRNDTRPPQYDLIRNAVAQKDFNARPIGEDGVGNLATVAGDIISIVLGLVALGAVLLAAAIAVRRPIP